VGAQLDVAAEAGREAAIGLGARVLGSCLDNAQARPDHQLTASVSLTFKPRGADRTFAPVARSASGRPLTALAAERPGEFQNDHGDERDSRNDRHPGRYLVEPLGMWCRRYGGRRCGGRRWDRRLSCLAHTSHNASGQQRPRAGGGREVVVKWLRIPLRHDMQPSGYPVEAFKCRSPAPPVGTPG